LQQECQNTTFGIFELLVKKETFAEALLKGLMQQHSLQNSPLESRCVVVALIENYSFSKSLKVYIKKSQILSCDNERYVLHSVVAMCDMYCTVL